MTPLRQRMIDDLKLRNRSPRTIETYISMVTRFAKFHGRSPEVLGSEEVRAYQKHLRDSGASWSTFNQTVSALKFLYGVTLHTGSLLSRPAVEPCDSLSVAMAYGHDRVGRARKKASVGRRRNAHAAGGFATGVS